MFAQLRYAVAFFLLLFVTTIWAEVTVPQLSKRITDLTATLTSEQSTALENKIAAFEAQKGSQIAVLILPTTQPETIEAFSIQVAETWKIGRKNIDDGVILIVAKDDRKLRVEVGRGLEGAIPDAIAKRVIAEIITPKFKVNDFGGGIDLGVSQLIKLINGENLPPIAEDTGVDSVLMIVGIGFLAILTFIGSIFLYLYLDFKKEDAERLKQGDKKGKHWQNSKQSDNSRNNTSSHSSSSSWSSSGSSWSGGGGGGFSGGGASGSW